MRWIARALLAPAGSAHRFNAELWFRTDSREQAALIVADWTSRFESYGYYVDTIEINERG